MTGYSTWLEYELFNVSRQETKWPGFEIQHQQVFGMGSYRLELQLTPFFKIIMTKTNFRRRYIAAMWLTLTWLLLLCRTCEYYEFKRESTIASTVYDGTKPSDAVTLVPGELPCYTG
jgi:hypothetical protein